MNLRLVLPLLFLVLGSCASDRGASVADRFAKPDPVAPAFDAEDLTVTVEWGNATRSLRRQIVVKPGQVVCGYTIRTWLTDQYSLQLMKKEFARELSSHKEYKVHSIHNKALARNIRSSDFFRLNSEDGQFDICRGGEGAIEVVQMLDGWAITITVKAGQLSRTVTLHNGSLNSFYIILRSIGNMDPEVSKVVKEPIGWMKRTIKEL